jgi:hypothetical protein
MSELLHDPSALADIAATWAEPARSWARALLAVWAPHPGLAPPVADRAWDPVLVRADGPSSWMASGWAVDPPSEGAAALAAQLPLWGHPIGDSLRAACLDALGNGRPADPWLALALAQSGGVPVAAARAAASAGSPRWVVAAVVLALVAETDAAIAAQTLSALDDDEAWAALVASGAPEDLPQPPRDLDAAAAAGRSIAGGPSWSPPPNRGSRRHRARALVETMLADRAGVLAAAARAALQRDRTPAFESRIVALAGWQSGLPPASDPLTRTLLHHGPPAIWAAAWAAAAGNPDAIDLALARISAGSLGAAVLAARLAPERAAGPVLQQTRRTPTLSWLSVACALAPWVHQELAHALAGPDRDRLLPVAAWCPTQAVLDALLGLPVPASADARRDWAWALASTGDVVAARRVLALESSLGPGTAGEAPALVRALGLDSPA